MQLSTESVHSLIFVNKFPVVITHYAFFNFLLQALLSALCLNLDFRQYVQLQSPMKKMKMEKNYKIKNGDRKSVV